MSSLWFDSLASACTASPTLSDLLAKCESGYVPTIYPSSRRRRLLIRVVRSFGFRVWTGSN